MYVIYTCVTHVYVRYIYDICMTCLMRISHMYICDIIILYMSDVYITYVYICDVRIWCVYHICICPIHIWHMYDCDAYVTCLMRISHMYTGWPRLIGSPKLHIIFHKRATKCRALLRKMTYSDKGSYESLPPCNIMMRQYHTYIFHVHIRHINDICTWHYICVYVYNNALLPRTTLHSRHRTPERSAPLFGVQIQSDPPRHWAPWYINGWPLIYVGPVCHMPVWHIHDIYTQDLYIQCIQRDPPRYTQHRCCVPTHTSLSYTYTCMRYAYMTHICDIYMTLYMYIYFCDMYILLWHTPVCHMHVWHLWDMYMIWHMCICV